MTTDEFQVLLVNVKCRTVLDVDIIGIEVFELSLVDFRKNGFVVGQICRSEDIFIFVFPISDFTFDILTHVGLLLFGF